MREYCPPRDTRAPWQVEAAYVDAEPCWDRQAAQTRQGVNYWRRAFRKEAREAGYDVIIRVLRWGVVAREERVGC